MNLKEGNAECEQENKKQFLPQNGKGITFSQVKDQSDPAFGVICYHAIA
jgi:hypothetical protein